MRNLLTELTSSPLLLSESGINEVELLVSRLISSSRYSGDKSVKPTIVKLHPNMICSDCMDGGDDNGPFAGYEDGSVVILPIIGMMMKYSGIDWDEWKYVIGMDSIANLIREADKATNIAGTVLLFNTPGGTTDSIYQLEDAMRNRTKPCIGLIDGMCESGGAYVASFCDKTFATNRMCKWGSVGTFAQLIDQTKMLENVGIKIISVYPPESSFKNLTYRKALEGDQKPMIEESLSPFAIHFQNIIKEGRPKIDRTVEGILEGREFYAYDAITHKAIDGLMNLDQAIAEVQTIANTNKQIYSQLKF